MPIFQDDLGDGRGSPPTKESKTPPISTKTLGRRTIMRKDSEESIRTDLCEGLVPDTLEEHTTLPAVLGLDTSFKYSYNGTSDRTELIERLKRGESPTWLPNRNLESLLQEDDSGTPREISSDHSNSSLLLQPADLSDTGRPSSVDKQRSQAGLEIERPRSALHSGDFTQRPQHNISEVLEQNPKTFDTRKSPWLATSSPLNFTPFQLDPRFPSVDKSEPIFSERPRAPSLSSSFSSSFVLKAPTSPLVQSESNDDLDLPPHLNPLDITSGTVRNNPRRHTLQASHSMHSTPSIPTSGSFNKPPQFRRENIYPYQAHQPRRSLASNTMPHSISSPQTPVFSRSRRPSYTPDASPLHASMVGSYEESILRGRMSTTPSKPLDFVAQIGVLGLGKCKASLRCPPHVTLPFPAVFYDYESTSHGRRGKSEDGPSPYVGCIDLENGLSSPEEARDNRRRRRNATIERIHTDDLDNDTSTSGQVSEREIRGAEKQKRRSSSPRAPPGGSYRIPEKGQLQIIIKNPNKTAVKLFLVPYDLTGMEPGTKTFIRQRSYSTGPIIESALSASPSPNPVPADTLDRPTLRYLVHLHMCSPSRGRYYLYKSIRVVFANRVPDGKEKLRNEITLPEPRFTTWKAVRDSTGNGGAALVADKAYRRRSSGFPLGRGFEGFGLGSAGIVEPVPFDFPSRREDANTRMETLESLQSPMSSERRTSSEVEMSDIDADGASVGTYDKLSRGDVGYGGNAFSPPRMNSFGEGRQVPEGLLALKLRGLGVGMEIQDLEDTEEGNGLDEESGMI